MPSERLAEPTPQTSDPAGFVQLTDNPQPLPLYVSMGETLGAWTSEAVPGMWTVTSQPVTSLIAWPSEGVIYKGAMPALEDLLRQNRVAYTVLDRSESQMVQTERRIWSILVAAAIVWGALTGVSFAERIWLDPAGGILGCLSIGVLAFTMVVHGRRR